MQKKLHYFVFTKILHLKCRIYNDTINMYSINTTGDMLYKYIVKQQSLVLLPQHSIKNYKKLIIKQ